MTADALLEAAARLRDATSALRLRVPYVYDPLRYAWAPHAAWLARYGGGRKRAIFLGMNPGHWGMAQTGVPFGDAPTVRGWMGITGAVTEPARVHPKRPIRGFAATRPDPSGARFYGWAQRACGTAEAFFARAFVTNHCPLLFFDDEGTNVTPPLLRKADRDALEPACDAHLAEVVRATGAHLLYALGTYAEGRARAVVEREALAIEVVPLPHPSPAHPLNNRGWSVDVPRWDD